LTLLPSILIEVSSIFVVIKTTDEFGAYARRIYASLGLGASA
jgi:hypothetical protein